MSLRQKQLLLLRGALQKLLIKLMSEILLYVHAIATIIYGAHRSSGLKQILEQDNDDLSLNPAKAILVTIASCVGILVCFYYFAVVSFVYTILALVTSSFGLLYCIHPYFNTVLPFKNEYTCLQERVSLNTLLLYIFSLWVALCWLILGDNTFLNNGTSICVLSMAIIKISNFKTGTVLLTSLFLYDIFWVFYSPYFFKENVMVAVATKEAPAMSILNQLNVTSTIVSSTLQLPTKLIYGYNLLGLGDIVIPGVFISYCYQVDSQRQKFIYGYFILSTIGYSIGLFIAMFCAQYFMQAQPALLYIVPSVLIPALTKCFLEGSGSQNTQIMSNKTN